MKNVTTTPELLHSTTESNSHLFDDWFDPIESGIRDRVRGLIEEMIRGELDAALSRPRYGRRAADAEDSGVAAVVTGHRHGRRVRTLTGTFGKTEIASPSGHFRTQLNGKLRFSSEGFKGHAFMPWGHAPVGECDFEFLGRQFDVLTKPLMGRMSVKPARPNHRSQDRWRRVRQ
jgi:hypothetical protein